MRPHFLIPHPRPFSHPTKDFSDAFGSNRFPQGWEKGVPFLSFGLKEYNSPLMDAEQSFFRAGKAKMHYARALRKTMTKTERILWEILRGRQFLRFKFRRQVPLRRFVVDFLCMAHRLIIEIDGPIHEKQRAYDREREEELLDEGFRILRFHNKEVLYDLPDVLRNIERAIFLSRDR